MIKTNKLRLGNYLKNASGEILQITKMVQESLPIIFCNEKEYECDVNVFGIPITDRDLILKFGFEPYHGDSSLFVLNRSKELGHNLSDVAFSIWDSGIQIRLWIGDNSKGILPCEYIHDLQNLVLSLTNYELKLLE